MLFSIDLPHLVFTGHAALHQSQKVVFNSNILCIVDVVKGLQYISICLQERQKLLHAIAVEELIL